MKEQDKAGEEKENKKLQLYSVQRTLYIDSKLDKGKKDKKICNVYVYKLLKKVLKVL